MSEKVKVFPSDSRVTEKDGGVLLTTIDKVVRTEFSPTALDLTIKVHDRRERKKFRKNIVGWVAAGALAVGIATPMLVVSEELKGNHNVETPQAELVEGVIFVTSMIGGVAGMRRVRGYNIELDRLECQEGEIRAYGVDREKKSQSVGIATASSSK